MNREGAFEVCGQSHAISIPASWRWHCIAVCNAQHAYVAVVRVLVPPTLKRPIFSAGCDVHEVVFTDVKLVRKIPVTIGLAVVINWYYWIPSTRGPPKRLEENEAPVGVLLVRRPGARSARLWDFVGA